MQHWDSLTRLCFCTPMAVQLVPSAGGSGSHSYPEGRGGRCWARCSGGASPVPKNMGLKEGLCPGYLRCLISLIRGWDWCPFLGDFEHHLQKFVGDYIPNSWVMWNIGTSIPTPVVIFLTVLGLVVLPCFRDDTENSTGRHRCALSNESWCLQFDVWPMGSILISKS